jgi:CubicO group peptidase (beta-lactamase class C family)
MKRSDLRKKLDPVVKKAMAELEVPGISVGIRIDDENHTFGYGVTNLDHGQPVDGETLFQIGSTSKTFTATAVMRLVEDGSVTLDDRIVDHLPSFKVPDADITAGVTVKHLLTHRSGWMGDWGGKGQVGRGDDAVRRRIAQMKKVPVLAPLGAVWSYNNLGFTVLGHLIEKVTKKTFEEVVTEGIIKPLGMERSFYYPEEIMTHKFALGHVKTPDGWRVVRPWAQGRATGPAGGVVSTAEDQLKYAQFHLNAHPEGKAVLQKKTVAFMQKPLAEAASLASHVGASWLLNDVGGVRTVAHGGTMVGQTSAFLMVPSKGFAITVLTNAGAEGSQAHRRITQWATEKLIGLERKDPETKPLSAKVADQVCGQYSYYTYGTIDVARVGEGLRLEWTPSKAVLKKNPDIASQLPPPVNLRPIGGLKFVAEDGPLARAVVDFVPKDGGEIGWVRMGGRIQPRVG